jgi:hypothetical protein
MKTAMGRSASIVAIRHAPARMPCTVRKQGGAAHECAPKAVNAVREWVWTHLGVHLLLRPQLLQHRHAAGVVARGEQARRLRRLLHAHTRREGRRMGGLASGLSASRVQHAMSSSGHALPIVPHASVGRAGDTLVAETPRQ